MSEKEPFTIVAKFLIIIAIALIIFGLVFFIRSMKKDKDISEGVKEDLFGDCVAMGGTVVTETATCELGEEKKLIGGQYCCILS